MTSVFVNTATPHDLGALVASVSGLFDEDAASHDPLIDLSFPARDGASYYSSLLHDPEYLIALARDGGQVVGHLVGKLYKPGFVQTGCIAVLESMRVAPQARRCGVGSLLVHHFFAWARQAGAEQASVTAYAANEGAKRFYEEQGFRPHSITARVAL